MFLSQMRHFTVFVVMFFAMQLHAQTLNPFYKRISALEGLPSQTVYYLFVAPSGLLYIGTEAGLVTYDGLRFELVENPFGKTQVISEIRIDAMGTIWCKNFSNQVFKLANNRLEVCAQAAILAKKGEIISDFEVEGNYLWLFTQSGLFRSHVQDTIFDTLFLLPDDRRYFGHLSKDESKQEILATTVGNIFTFSYQGEALDTFNLPDGALYTKAIGGEVFLNGRENLKFLGKLSDRKSIKTDFDEKNVSWNYWVSINNAPWISSNSGIHPYNAATNTIEQGFFSGKRISHVTEDHDGNIWLGTLDEGLLFVPSLDVKFWEFRNTEGTIKHFTALINKGQELVAGTADGYLYFLNAKNGKHSSYFSQANSPIEFLRYQSGRSRLIHSYGFFEPNNVLQPYIYLGKDIHWDQFGNYLAVSSNGAVMMTPTKHKDGLSQPSFLKDFQEFKIQEKTAFKFFQIDVNRGRSAWIDTANQRYFFGTDNGLFVLDQHGKRELRYGGKSVLAFDILQTNNHQIWVGTATHGLLVFDGDSVVKVFADLPGAQCKRMVYDGQDGLWLLTSKGISFLDLKTHKIKDLTMRIPLVGIEINDLAVNEKQQVFLATNLGLIGIPTASTRTNAKPKVEIVRIRSGQLQLNPDSAIGIPFKSNQILFEVASYNYGSFGNFHYEYSLLGHNDETWTRVPAQNNKIAYLSLPPGKYEFQIRSVVNGVYSPTQTQPFEVLAPYWMRWWFVLLTLLALGGLVYLGYLFVIQRTRKQEAVKEQLAVSQITALRAQMSPHFIFNILNSIQGLIYSNQKNEASDLLGRFSELMRNTLEYSGKNYIQLRKEIDHLKMYVSLEKERFDDDFEFSLSIDPDLEIDKIEIPSMILQPFVENAIKHGLLHQVGIKRLAISFQKYEKATMMVEIDDNGVGRSAAEAIVRRKKKHLSFATNSIEERISLINQIASSPIQYQTIDKKDALGNARGTKILIVIPYESGNH